MTLVPFGLLNLQRELELYIFWYNRHRPHAWLRGATPDEVYHR